MSAMADGPRGRVYSLTEHAEMTDIKCDKILDLFHRKENYLPT